MCRRRLVALATVVLASWSYACAAQAEGSAVQIRWDEHAACPRPVRLEPEITALLGAPLDSARALRADVSVAKRAARYLLTLQTDAAQGYAERAVALRSCAEVERAAVLLVATALQTDRAATEVLGEPVRSEAPAGTSAVTPPPGSAHDAPPGPGIAVRLFSPREPLSLWLRLGAGLDVASLPGATAGLFGGVGMNLRPWRAWIDGRYFLPREHVDPTSGQPAELGLFAAALGSSLVFALRRASLGPAVEIELGAQRARVLGAQADGSARTAWAALLCGGHAELLLRSGVALALDALLGLPLRRPGFAIDDRASFYRTGAFTARFVLGVQVHLGP